MSPEETFLGAIESNPDDQSSRFAYADWLSESGGMARAELIRVEDEMRRVPIYGDRYWALKPRRNALRQNCGAAWLRRMRYGTDYDPVFGHIPDGWRARWRLIREFTERWHGVRMPDVGGRAAEVDEFERRLGRPLPAAVREWIAYNLDLMGQSRFDAVFRDCFQVEDLQPTQGLPAVSLMLQGEGDYYWAVRKAHLHARRRPDPPVHPYRLDWDAEGNPFIEDGPEPAAPRVTSWVFRHVGIYTHGDGGGIGANFTVTDTLVRQLEQAFPVRSRFDRFPVYESRNMIVLADASLEPGTDTHIHATFWKPLPPRDVPEVLLQLMRSSGVSYKMLKRS